MTITTTTDAHQTDRATDEPVTAVDADDLGAEIVSLHAQAETLRQEQQILRADRDDLAQQLSRSRLELTEFQAIVRSVAGRYARDHDWCDVVSRGLEEMGLEGLKTRYSATVTVTYHVTGTRRGLEQISEYTFENEVTHSDGEFTGDCDWSDVESYVHRVDVTELEATDTI